jgi:hypothetical protein
LPVTSGADKMLRLVRFYRENSGVIRMWSPGNFPAEGTNCAGPIGPGFIAYNKWWLKRNENRFSRLIGM